MPVVMQKILAQRPERPLHRILLGMTVVLGLAGCDAITEWTDNTPPPLPGERIAVMLESSDLQPDERLSDLTVKLPHPYLNQAWPQAGGYPDHAMHHLLVQQDLSEVFTIDFGEGSDSSLRILSGPVVADGVLFTMDSFFRVRSWDAETGDLRWTYDPQVPEEDFDAFGGGLAYLKGRLFISTGFAQIIGVSASDGSELWRADLPSPARAAPSAEGNAVVTITIDNQALAFNPETGDRIWTHAGFSETAGLLGGASPAIEDNMTVLPYSSGEVVAVRTDTGRVLWSDTLTTVRRIDTLSTLADIRGLPVIDRGIIYAVSHAGRTIALDQRTGIRVWDRQIGGSQSPWIAGEFIYLLTGENALTAITRRGGRVRWVVGLPSWEDPEDRDDPISWVGPILVGDRLLLGNSLGEILAVSPYTGDALGKIHVGGAIRVPPIVANGYVYVQTDDGSIVALR